MNESELLISRLRQRAKDKAKSAGETDPNSISVLLENRAADEIARLRACLEWFVQEDRGFGADEALRRFSEKTP